MRNVDTSRRGKVRSEITRQIIAPPARDLQPSLSLSECCLLEGLLLTLSAMNWHVRPANGWQNRSSIWVHFDRLRSCQVPGLPNPGGRTRNLLVLLALLSLLLPKRRRY